MYKIYRLLIILKSSLDELRRNKLRTVLTSFGITIAIAGVTAIAGIMAGVEQDLTRDFQELGSETIIVKPNIYLWYQTNNLSTMSLKEQLALQSHVRGISKVASFSPFSFQGDGISGTQFSLGDKKANGTVLAISESLANVVNRYPLKGRFFKFSDSESRRRVCLVNIGLANQLDISDISQTKYLQLGNIKCRVIGIMPGSNKDILGTSADVYLPLGTAAQLNLNAISLRFAFKVLEDANAQGILKNVSNILRASQKTPRSSPNNFIIQDANEIKSLSKEVYRKIAGVLFLVVSIALIVGGIGIMNVMLASVNERTREIGLLRAIGASQEYIKVKFLVESSLLTLFGGVLGIALGYLTSIVLSSILGTSGQYIPLWSIYACISFSILIGLVCGLGPAMKAAKLPPIDALRAS
ncbi:ABC transporter permease [Psychrosphaera haliotis]|uniref:FtsX-like permease family protein n=1 Tax=Psychrosphaera haliotis TaxID=555083 RepID=A0A6N8FCC2_9GAMM|nr:ABC transporter permease [Psychrosphaera haliotis]MUH72807.1 FtsX-like permease family protein [Psychrosphaera haliotis]